METSVPRQLPVAVTVADDRTRSELAAAIALVSAGTATRIALANMSVDDALAGEGAAFAQTAGVAFSVVPDRVTGHRVITVGPRLTP